MATQVDQLYDKNHWDGWNYQSLYEYYKDRNWQRGLEVGFAWSMSAQAFLDATDGTLLSLDVNDAMDKKEFMERKYGNRWELRLGDSSTLMSKLKEKFDYIYIDGDHTYKGVKKDLWQAPRLLKKGGVIICDDFGNAQSIRDAVAEFCEKFKFTNMEVIPSNNNGAVVLCAST